MRRWRCRRGIGDRIAARVRCACGCPREHPVRAHLLNCAVLPELRGRGAYRALVRARWDHAAARGTPLLVVQAGDLSAPVLDRLGFVRRAVVKLYVDRL